MGVLTYVNVILIFEDRPTTTFNILVSDDETKDNLIVKILKFLEPHENEQLCKISCMQLRPPPLIKALEKEHKFKMGKYSIQKILSIHVILINNVKIRIFTSQSPNNIIFHTAYLVRDDEWIKKENCNISDGYITFTRDKWYYFHDASSSALILVPIKSYYDPKKIYDTVV